jgi:CRP-like cAMP-binding protein
MSKLLEKIIPFRFLHPTQLEALRVDISTHRFLTGEVILEVGAHDNRVYLVESGLVETRNPTANTTLLTMGPGRYFGERTTILGEPWNVEMRALEPTTCLAIDGARFLRLLHDSRPFAQAFGDILRGKQGIFIAFERFMAELLHQVSKTEILVKHLLDLYTKLEPAIHPRASAEELDTSALSYAVRRLPDNITSTFAYLFTDSLPALYQDPDKTFQHISTKARPRAVYEMLPGKSMVLLRDGLSDLIDLVTCLCLFSVEAKKIRHRINSPQTLRRLVTFMKAEPKAAPSRIKEFMLSLPLEANDCQKLLEIWPEHTIHRLYEIVIHHEDFRIEVHKQLNNYHASHSELWTTQIAEATLSLMGYYPSELPDEIEVHVISSNTHSVANCLSSYLTEHAQEILDWAKRESLIDPDEVWVEQQDLVYSLARQFFQKHPEKAKERNHQDGSSGMLRLKETAFTGIEVQLFDTKVLQNKRIDQSIKTMPTRRSLLVNIDFAFGQQAEEIIANLLMLFGRKIKSVNVLGKAGALVGKRGDILCPTAFLEQSDDMLHQLPHVELKVDRLSTRVPDRGVHVGPLLTVAGTLLQNRMMLHFYKHIWGCVGLEMEGAFYYRQLLESMHLGVISKDVALRFLYYISDLPLDTSSTLSGRMNAIEGIPPLYAVTREILTEIFE